MSTITLISGANQGIGLAVATRLAKEHKHRVIVGSRSAAEGAEIASSLEAEGYTASSVQLDLSSDSSIAAAVKTIEDTYGRLDVLVNNAAVLLDGKKLDQSPRDLFTQTMTTNVIGTACLTEAFLPLLRKSELPRVIFVSSQMGSLHQATVRDTPFFAVDFKSYDASKAAVNMLALNYARILEDVGGRVNAACPGLVSTNMTKDTGYSQYGSEPYEGAQRIVELATSDENGPTATFSNRDGPVAW